MMRKKAEAVAKFVLTIALAALGGWVMLLFSPTRREMSPR